MNFPRWAEWERSWRGIRFAILSDFFATSVVLTTGSWGSCFQIWECPLQALGLGGSTRCGLQLCSLSAIMSWTSRRASLNPFLWSNIGMMILQCEGVDHAQYNHLYKTPAQKQSWLQLSGHFIRQVSCVVPFSPRTTLPARDYYAHFTEEKAEAQGS